MLNVLRFSLAACLLLTVACTVPSPGPDPGRATVPVDESQVKEFMVRDARSITDRAAVELSSKETWEAVRDQRRTEMMDMLGLNPLPERTPLNVRITGTLEREEFRVERIAFESLPKVYVTANLYLPKGVDSQFPAVVYVCGHAFSEHGDKTAYQRHPITLARHGYVCMILDSIQIAETFALHHGVLNNEMYDWYSRGYTPAGVEVWNAIRALDYLETRPEVDASRFGMTGRSGGAAMSWFTAAVDDRIRVVAPIMGNSTYAANLERNTQRLHCDCMFAINTYRHDLMHQGALIAPRPLLMAHGIQDDLFPVEGYQEFEKTLLGLYRSYGAGESFQNLVVDSAHADSDFLRAAVVRWFDRWLKGVPEREIDVTVDEIPAERLAVFEGNPPADALNYRVHEFFTAGRPFLKPANTSEWMGRKAELMSLLRERVFRAFPDDSTAPLAEPEDRALRNGFQPLLLETDKEIRIQAAFRPGEVQDAPALLYVASDGEDWAATLDTLRQTAGASRNSILVVYPRGVSVTPWSKKSWKDVLRNAMQLGRTVDSMRVWDIVQASRHLAGRVPSEIVVTGIGVSGTLGLYAALFEGRIGQVILIDPPVSHRQGPTFLNVLRYTDLPEAAALLAPRRLTFLGRIPSEFEHTAGIYELLGHGNRFSLTMSLDAALNGRHDHNFASGL